HVPIVMAWRRPPMGYPWICEFPEDPPMKHPLAAALAVALTAAVSAQAQPGTSTAGAALVKPPTADDALTYNPLFVQCSLPLRFPQFDRIRDEHFAPAYDAGMAQELQEIEAIVSQKAEPTFENTIIALEKSGKLLTNARRIFGNLNGTDTND